jgi:hypothetical protein
VFLQPDKYLGVHAQLTQFGLCFEVDNIEHSVLYDQLKDSIFSAPETFCEFPCYNSLVDEYSVGAIGFYMLSKLCCPTFNSKGALKFP